MKKIFLKNGFTLVELLVVMVIISVLIGLSVFGISQIQKSTRDNSRKNNLKQINIAIENFYNQKRTLPACSSGANECPLQDILDNTQYKASFASANINSSPDKNFNNYTFYKGLKTNTYYVAVKNMEDLPSECTNKTFFVGGISNIDFSSSDSKPVALRNLPKKCSGN